MAPQAGSGARAAVPAAAAAPSSGRHGAAGSITKKARAGESYVRAVRKIMFLQPHCHMKGKNPGGASGVKRERIKARRTGMEGALYKGGGCAGGGSGHIINPLLEEEAPVVRHDARADLLSLYSTTPCL